MCKRGQHQNTSVPLVTWIFRPPNEMGVLTDTNASPSELCSETRATTWAHFTWHGRFVLSRLELNHKPWGAEIWLRSHLHPLRIHKLHSSPEKTLEEMNKAYSFLILCLHGESPVPLRSRFPPKKQAPKDLVLNQPRISRKGTYRSSLAFPANIFLLIQFVYLV